MIKKRVFRWKIETTNRCTATYINDFKVVVSRAYDLWRSSATDVEIRAATRALVDSPRDKKKVTPEQVKLVTDSMHRYIKMVFDMLDEQYKGNNAYFVNAKAAIFGVNFEIDQLREQYLGAQKAFASGGIVAINCKDGLVPTTARLVLTDHSFKAFSKRSVIHGMPSGRLLNRTLMLVPIKNRKELFAAYVHLGDVQLVLPASITPYCQFLNYGYFVAHTVGMDLVVRTYLLPGYFGTPEAKTGSVVPDGSTLFDTYDSLVYPPFLFLKRVDGKVTVNIPDEHELEKTKPLPHISKLFDDSERVEISKLSDEYLQI